MNGQDMIDSMGMGVIAGFMVFYLLVALLLAGLVYFPYRKLPPQYQEMPAWSAWLLAVPLVGLIFQWILLAFKIPAAFQRYFQDHPPSQDMGDCGKNYGLITAVFNTASILFGPLGLVGLVFYILFLVKLNTMAGQLQG
ncbi:hypothetical protein [Gallaecimonas sp. GXIMD4217]|uniref:hypothetical protein n=1 Tax=Gallaecimonas sp. GXIMD4217 TaxID=3131927 RepID=UPI00311B355E